MAEDSYRYPHDRIADVLDGIPSNIKDTYPEHIIEPERLEIGRQLVLKELYKLYPFMDARQLEGLGEAMVEWIDGRDQEMAPIHDYWNYIDGQLLGLKLKDIVPYLTSENIIWRHELIDSRDMDIYCR